MFEYIHLKNYKSFSDLTFNLQDHQNKPKQLALIYGDNGIGKSNLASAFIFLAESLRTMDARDLVQSLLSHAPEDLDKEDFTRFLKQRYRDMETLIASAKMVGTDEPMLLEFGFRLDGRKGKYSLEADNAQLIHERLEFTLSKNRGVYCDITPEKIKISSKIFLNAESYHEIQFACKKYWGKHSFLAILIHESQDKANTFIKDQLSMNLKNVLHFLNLISCQTNNGSAREHGIIGLPDKLNPELTRGDISIKNEDDLNRQEKMLDLFFHFISPDVKKVYYNKTRRKNEIHYNLRLIKHIAGMDRDLDFNMESTGTRSLVSLLPYMLMVAEGSTVIIDEFDTGLHDSLVRKLLYSLRNSISDGQIIMTTHNTYLMDSDISRSNKKESSADDGSIPPIPVDSLYVINEDSEGFKKIQCMVEYNPRLKKMNRNTNVRNQYLLQFENESLNLTRRKRSDQQDSINFHELFKIVYPE